MFKVITVLFISIFSHSVFSIAVDCTQPETIEDVLKCNNYFGTLDIAEEVEPNCPDEEKYESHQAELTCNDGDEVIIHCSGMGSKNYCFGGKLLPKTEANEMAMDILCYGNESLDGVILRFGKCHSAQKDYFNNMSVYGRCDCVQEKNFLQLICTVSSGE